MAGEPSDWIPETAAFYSSREMGARSGYGLRPAVVVVDMSRAFCDPDHPVGSDMTETLESIAALLEATRRKGLLTVYTTIAYHPSGEDAGVWALKLPTLKTLLIGDRMTEIHPRIAPLQSEHVLVKKYGSSFFMTPLLSLLNSRRVDTVLLTGCSTSGCIRATAIDSVSYGFRTVVPRECVADRAAGPHEANLFDIDTKYADVVALEEVLDYVSAL
jgi:nicotinamidase-related amidase